MIKCCERGDSRRTNDEYIHFLFFTQREFILKQNTYHPILVTKMIL
jgi:hypothetical protein